MPVKKNKKIPENEVLLGIEKKYLVDLECLREMHSSVVPLLKEKDKERKDLLTELFKKVSVTPPKNEKKSEKSVLNEDHLDNGDSKDSLNGNSSKKKNMSIEISGSEVEILISNIDKLERAQSLFEKQAIVTLVSRFDEFLGQTIKLVLGLNPSWLKSNEKTITYKELIDLKSIDRAIEGVIQKEVENLLRDSHEEQIPYIDEKLKLGIVDTFGRFPQFLEIAERRNLFVHTGGIVSQQYLDKCHGFKINLGNVSCETHLKSDEQYFLDAFSVYFEMGLRISQGAYRRLFPDDLEAADNALNKLTIKFMNEGEYNLAEIITAFDLAIPPKLRFQEREYLYFAHINRAFVLKFSDKEFEDVLGGIHWNAFHPKYALCLHALRDEFDDAANLMKSEEIGKVVGQEGFKSWPVFREFRGTMQFKLAYKEMYGVEYAPDSDRDNLLRDKGISEKHTDSDLES